MKHIIVFVLALVIASCGNKKIENDVVTVQSGSSTHEVVDAKILKIRNVYVESESAYADIVGSIAGAGIGSEIARDNGVGAETGALLGGVLGHAAGKTLGKDKVLMKQYVVSILDTGERIAITQQDINLSVGQNVMIVMSNPPQILK